MNDRTTIPAVVALSACCLLLTFAPGPAHSAPSAATGNATAAAKPKVEYSDVAPALAAEIKEKTAFLAEVQPRLWAAGYQADRDGTPRERQSRRLAEQLWRLRALPDVLNAQKAALLAPVVEKNDERRGQRERTERDKEYYRKEELQRRVHTLERLLDQAHYLAREIQEFEDKESGTKRPRYEVDRNMPVAERISEAQARAKKTEQYFTFTLNLQSRLQASQDDRSFSRRESLLFWRLRDRPADTEIALTMLKDRDLRGRERETLLEKLIANPLEAKDEFSRLAETRALKRVYSFLMEMESPYEVISLPLSVITPRILEAVEKPGFLPLAAKPVGAPAPGLTMRRMTELLPRDIRDQLGDKKRRLGNDVALPALPFLRPDERLYIIMDESAPRGSRLPVAAGTPLSDLSTIGPVVEEYVPGAASLFDGYLAMAADTERLRWNSTPMLIAAACPPHELAAHLSSLMVMKTERERSLFGPFETYAWKPKEVREVQPSTKSIEPYPVDTPGAVTRLVKISKLILFTGLAPQADAAGLARLLGPIRGIWAYEGPSRDTPWLEMRYNPPAAVPPATPTPAPLGKALVLTLEKAALESIVGKERAFVTLVLTQNIAGQECSEKKLAQNSPECAGIWAGALARTENTMAELLGKGFISPLDAAMPVYFLDRYKDDADITATLQALINDTAKPAKERVTEMRKISDAERARRLPKKP